jgi:predicted GIY-YIG superfamily endonuclease
VARAAAEHVDPREFPTAALAPQGDAALRNFARHPEAPARHWRTGLEGCSRTSSAEMLPARSNPAQHQQGTYRGYTFTRRPVHLVWSEYFARITDAIAVERQLKGWSRAKKEALINSDWKTLRQLSKRRAGRLLDRDPSS